MVQGADAPVPGNRVLPGLLASQLVQPGRRRGRHLDRRQRIDLLGSLAVGQAGQLLGRPRVAHPQPAQFVGSDEGVVPEHGDDQVLGANVGSAGLGGDPEGLIDHEPQAPDDARLCLGDGRRGGLGGKQGGGELAGLVGSHPAGAQQGRSAGVLVIPLPEDRDQQGVRGPGRASAAGQVAGGP